MSSEDSKTSKATESVVQDADHASRLPQDGRRDGPRPGRHGRPRRRARRVRQRAATHSGGSGSAGDGRAIKVGFVSAAHRPARRVRRDRPVAASSSGRPPSRTASSAATARPTPSRSSSRTRSRTRTAPPPWPATSITNDGVDIMMVASTPDTVSPVVRPGRGAADPVRLQRLPVAAVLLRPRRRPRRGLHVDLPRLLGPRGRHRRVHRHVGPAQDQQEGRRDVAERRRRPRLGRPQDRSAADAQGMRATPSSTAAASRTAPRTTRRRSASSRPPTATSSAASSSRRTS